MFSWWFSRWCPEVGLGIKMYNRSDFTFRFTLTFTSAFLLKNNIWVPFMLGSWNLIYYLPRPKPFTQCQSCLSVWGEVRGQMYNWSDWAFENGFWKLLIQMLLPYGQRPKAEAFFFCHSIFSLLFLCVCFVPEFVCDTGMAFLNWLSTLYCLLLIKWPF